MLENVITPTEPPYPPTDVGLFNVSLKHLTFIWNEADLPSDCPNLHYRVVASNCGQCPEITSNTTATCVGNYTNINFRDDIQPQCSFAVQAVVCNDVAGNLSMAVNVTLPGMSV